MGEIESNRRSKSQVWLVVAIVVLAITIDQVLKLYIASHFALGESREVFSWFWLCYVENNGMAFGIEWFSKLALTLFRLLAVGALGWYVHVLIHKEHAGTGFIATIAFIIAGALGNIIDCVAYGKLFQGCGWFYGRVVDMFYFPLIHNQAGEVIFFRPVFNFADSCITCAVAAIFLFYMKDLNKTLDRKEEKKA
ncbi:MAG: signal peptidase II [Paludibacteraceae bacterium]|nr:signal peptidase II [Paludibacteraceae bacterium]